MATITTTSKNESASELLKKLSDKDFLTLGVHHLAYIRPLAAENDAGRMFALYAANGLLLTVQEESDALYSLARHNDLEPLTVH
jgi:hypothetical protein